MCDIDNDILLDKEIKMIDGRGKHMVAVANENFKTVKKYFKLNPKAMKIDCQRDTGLSAVTVRKNVKRMMGEKS